MLVFTLLKSRPRDRSIITYIRLIGDLWDLNLEPWVPKTRVLPLGQLARKIKNVNGNNVVCIGNKLNVCLVYATFVFQHLTVM